MALAWNSLPFLRLQRRWLLSEATLSARCGCGQAVKATQGILYGFVWIKWLLGPFARRSLNARWNTRGRFRASTQQSWQSVRSQGRGPWKTLAIFGCNCRTEFRDRMNRGPGKYLSVACALAPYSILAPYIPLVVSAIGRWHQEKLTRPTCDFVCLIFPYCVHILYPDVSSPYLAGPFVSLLYHFVL